jgi:hypothetical protein
MYPWGFVEVDNTKHSDFSRLRSALLKYVLVTIRLRRSGFNFIRQFPLDRLEGMNHWSPSFHLRPQLVFSS